MMKNKFLILFVLCIFSSLSLSANDEKQFELELNKPGITTFYFYDPAQAVGENELPQSMTSFSFPFLSNNTTSLEIGVYFDIFPESNGIIQSNAFIDLVINFRPNTKAPDVVTGYDFMLSKHEQADDGSYTTISDVGLNMDYEYRQPNVTAIKKEWSSNERAQKIDLASTSIQIYKDEPVDLEGLHSSLDARLSLSISSPNDEAAFVGGTYAGVVEMVLTVK